MEIKPKEVRGLICDIYESKDLGNCSNNGISARYNKVLVIMEEEEARVFGEKEDRPTVRIVKRVIYGREYIHAKPVSRVNRGNRGYMMGGCFIHSGDSRFRRLVSEYPVPLHDRQETPSENELGILFG